MKLTQPKRQTHQDRIRAVAHVPVEIRPHVFRWSPKQSAMGKRIFLRDKWRYDNSAITAYGVNGRLFNRNHPQRYAHFFRERNYGQTILGR